MEFIITNFGKVILAIFFVSVLFLAIKNYARINKFILEVKTELKKVSWSSRQELMAATLMVIVITALLVVFIGVVDLSFSRALRVVIK